MKARIKRIQINPEVLLHIMAKDSAWKMVEGVPRGSKLRGASIDPYTQVLILLIENDSFDEIDVNTMAPLISTEFERI
jgi:hypothetical protein